MYQRYTVIYETSITSTESGYLNDAKLYYDDKELPSKHYSKLSKDAGALNVYKYVDKTKVKNNLNDQKIKYNIIKYFNFLFNYLRIFKYY